MGDFEDLVCSMMLDERKISYFWTRGGEEAIVFLHGLGCSKHSFLSAFENQCFPSGYTLLAPDFLGHGESSKPKDFGYTLEEQASVVAKLLQRLSIRRPNIVAHSMGGAVGLLLVDMLNEVNGFFCLEGNLVPEDCKISRRVSSMVEVDFVEKLFPMAPLKFRCRGLESDPPVCPEAFYRSAKSLVDWSVHGELLQRFKGLSMRKAYLYGEENQGMPVLEKLKGLDVVQIDGCGHFMMMDNPADTYGEIAKRL